MKRLRLEKLNCELPNEVNALGPLPSVAAGDRRRYAHLRRANVVSRG